MTRGTSAWPAAWTCLFLLALLPAAVSGINCGKVNVSPVADFDYSLVPSETAPISVNFFSTSTGGRAGAAPIADPIDSYHWNFGDGSVSDENSPAHTYASGSARFTEEDKVYSVTLTIKTKCDRVSVVTKNVSAYCLNHTPGFTITQPALEGPYAAPVALYLKDTSVHARESVTSWHYTVWDAGMTRLFLESTEKDPVFILRNGGNYVIRQEIHKACSAPAARNTVVTKTIAVTGSAESDALPMETLPFTPIPTTLPAGATITRTTQPVTTIATTRPTTAALPQLADLPPGTGMLSVSTSPAGAEVFVNDAPLGTSPVTIPGLSVGRYNLRLEKEGYRNDTVQVEIGERKLTEYSATLVPPSSGGMDALPFIPIIAAVVAVAICAGAAALFLRRKKRPPEQRRRGPDGNALFLVEELGK